MTYPIYFPSGIVETIILWDYSSHEEDKAHVKDVGGVAWGPIKEVTCD